MNCPLLHTAHLLQVQYNKFICIWLAFLACLCSITMFFEVKCFNGWNAQTCCRSIQCQQVWKQTLQNFYIKKGKSFSKGQENKYFELKKLVGLPPQLELLAVFSRKSGHDMSKQCNHLHRVWAHTDADCAYIFLSLSPSSFGSVQSNLASHAHYTAYPQCISVLQDINTIWKCSEMHTHRSQGHSSRCLVKTEENSFEHKQHSLLETVVTYMFSLHAKLSYAKQ